MSSPLNHQPEVSLTDTRVRIVQPDSILEDTPAIILLTAFYGLEMRGGMEWSVAQRHMQLHEAMAMLKLKRSRMYILEDQDGTPCAMAIITKTSNRKIRRLDAIFVISQLRRLGLARKLLKIVRSNGWDLHSYSAPEAAKWHLACGFRVIRERPDDGTIEMFTGSYRPVYSFKHAAPLITDLDIEQVTHLEALERQLYGSEQ